MASVYFTNAALVQMGPSSAWQPTVPAGTDYAVMMLHEPSAKACIVSPNDNLTGTGIVKLVTGTSWSDLRANGRSTQIPGNMRNQINSWCTANGFQPLPSTQMTWAEAILFVCQQVNPAASLDQTFLNDTGETRTA